MKPEFKDGSDRELDELWDDLLRDGGGGEFRDRALAAAVRSARGRRARRPIVAAAGVMAAVALLVFPQLRSDRFDASPDVVLNERARVEASEAFLPSPVVESGARSGPMAASERRSRPNILSDDELLALFPGQPLALIGPPGRQRLVALNGAREGRGRSGDGRQ